MTKFVLVLFFASGGGAFDSVFCIYRIMKPQNLKKKKVWKKRE